MLYNMLAISVEHVLHLFVLFIYFFHSDIIFYVYLCFMFAIVVHKSTYIIKRNGNDSFIEEMQNKHHAQRKEKNKIER